MKKEQTITVYRRDYNDTNAYITGYKTASPKIEVFDVKVKPNDFWDRMLLTHEDENILTDIVKALAGLAFAWYIFKLEYDNVFSKRSFIVFWLALSLSILTFLALDIGAGHTSSFYHDLSAAKNHDKSNYDYEFERGLKTTTLLHNYWMYLWVPMIIMNFYKTFKLRHEGEIGGRNVLGSN
ncbi:hypothetical protein [Mucilaginibacter sp.]|uniref:hypothetical protein n=1 Tax=Mucilaginibacter sp. TaxID=1882438 RepID=UPI00285223EE|nr:hypothetical protein [Mucilaginibacter sp.]MDR3695580.1 hypothetical protein [Mucilaginibacter sp.]